MVFEKLKLKRRALIPCAILLVLCGLFAYAVLIEPGMLCGARAGSAGSALGGWIESFEGCEC